MVCSGPSGVGKSTLLKKLMKEYEGVFGFSISRKCVYVPVKNFTLLLIFINLVLRFVSHE